MVALAKEFFVLLVLTVIFGDLKICGVGLMDWVDGRINWCNEGDIREPDIPLVI
jgi:hypothetical protein